MWQQLAPSLQTAGKGKEVMESSALAPWAGAEELLFLVEEIQTTSSTAGAWDFTTALKASGSCRVFAEEGLEDVVLPFKFQPGHHMKERSWYVVEALG